MAARIHPFHDDRTRAKIQTTQLVNRLQSFANGEIELNRNQIKAIEVLLKKSLPDLMSVQHGGDLTHAVKISGALTWQPPQ